jgi:photosystem II stability/assembly factor-like uncharacterized protein
MRQVLLILLMSVTVGCIESLQAEEWADLSENLKSAGGGRGGIGIDPDSNQLYYLAGRNGIFTSTDQGETWTSLDDGFIKAAQWYVQSLQVDPHRGGRLAAFTKDKWKDPWQSGYTLDGGKTWKPITRVKNDNALKSYGWAWGLVDWSQDEPTFLMGRLHHSDWVYVSRDAGQSWTLLEGGSVYMGLYDSENIVRANLGRDKGGIVHSADGGTTWTKGSDLQPTAYLAKRYKDKFYWLVKGGLAVSSDGGKTWTKTSGELEYPYFGPLFGPTENDMIVVALDGVYQTADGGATWTKRLENKAKLHADEQADGKGFKLDWFLGDNDWVWDHKNGLLFLKGAGGFYRLDLSTLDSAE